MDSVIRIVLWPVQGKAYNKKVEDIIYFELVFSFD